MQGTCRARHGREDCGRRESSRAVAENPAVRACYHWWSRCGAESEPTARRWPGRRLGATATPCRGVWRSAADAGSTGDPLRVQSHRQIAPNGLARGLRSRAGARCDEATGFGRADENRLAHEVIRQERYQALARAAADRGGCDISPAALSAELFASSWGMLRTPSVQYQ